ncbi:MAG: glycosyltransferase family 4 protein [Bacteroidaceae bacterium]|nr:glycosyltransferase family 4 protein [Bacteroidaceae bacterium]
MKTRIIRISTVPMSLNLLLKGQLKMLSEHYDVLAVSSPGDDLQLVANREEVRVEPVAMERHISPIKDLKSLIRLVKLFRRERPWLVHSLTPKAGLLSMLAARICNVPVRVHTFTGLVFPYTTGLKRRLLMFTDRLTCACATVVNPEGEGVKRDLERAKITNKPLVIIGNGNVNGIDLDYYQPSEVVSALARKYKRDDMFTFCFVGRVVGDKGMNELARAFQRLMVDHPKVRLLIVGSFEEKLDPLQPENKEFFLNSPQVGFMGWQDDIRPFLAASDAFVFPSYREGFPNVLLQAGAMELPSIVTDINGANEIIRDGENGLIIPPKDEERLYQAMLHLVEHPEETRRMAGQARPMITSRYEQHAFWNQLLQFYSSLSESL